MKHICFLIVTAVMVDSRFAQPFDGRRPARLRRSPVKMRAEAPRQWDKSMKNFFAEDAFTLLGDRNLVPPPPPPPALPQLVPQKPFDREAVMEDLEKAKVQLTEVLLNEKGFRAGKKELDRSIQVLVENAEALERDDAAHKDDETYKGLAREMRATAKAISGDPENALKINPDNTSYANANSAFLALKRVCNDCHDKYRLGE